MTRFPRLLRIALLVACVLALAWPEPARADVALALSPASTRAFAGGAITFIGSGGSGAGYAFTLASAPSGGKISAAGAYVAGPLGGVVDVVQIVDSAGATAQTTVDVISTLAIGASSSSVAIGGSLVLVASRGSGTGYVWSLASAPSGGSISSLGAYTAGLRGEVTDVIVLTDSVGNQATLAVSVTSGLAIAPSFPHVVPGTKIGFVASGGSGGDYAYTLSKNASGASLNAFGVYTAGPLAGVTDAVLVRDGYGNEQTTTITVDAIVLTPSNPTVVAGASKAFVASGGSGHGYVWSLASAPSGGTVNALGIYTAGLVAGVSDVVRVEDSSGNVSTTRVRVAGPTITPATASVAIGATHGFVAAGGAGGYGWSLAKNVSGGSITSFGLYRAGMIAGGTDVVQVEDARGNKSTASVTVTGGPTLTPSTPSVAIGMTLGFVASGGSGHGYAWSMARSTSGGSINAFGVYTAGRLGGTDVIEVADSAGSSATTTITVTSGLTVTPESPIVYQGAALALVARGGSGGGYDWSLSENASGATISNIGIYTAGAPDASANVTDTVRVIDSTGNSATVTITVLPPPPTVQEADGGLVVGAAGEAPDDSGCRVAAGAASRIGDASRSLAFLVIVLLVTVVAARRRARSSL